MGFQVWASQESGPQQTIKSVFRIPLSGTLELQVRTWRRCFPMSECKPRTGSHPTQGSHRRVTENGPFLDEGWQTGLLEATESIVRCPSVLLFRLMWASKRRESSLAATVFLQFLPPGETHPYTKGVLPRFLPSGNTRHSRLLSDSSSSSPETPKCISHPPPYTPHPHSRRTPIASRKTPLSSLTSIGCCH